MARRVVEEKVVLDLLENPIPINYEEVPEFTKEDYEERIGKVNRICEERVIPILLSMETGNTFPISIIYPVWIKI